MRNVRAMMMSIGVQVMSMAGHVIGNSFMHWSNMLARLMPRTIARGCQHRIMRRKSFVVSRRVRFVSLTAGAFKKSLATPESHRHQSRHVEGGTDRGDGSHQPDEPAIRNL